MAEAQGELLITDREWQRVKSLGKEVLSDRRYTEAQVARQQAMARVLAYGMSAEEADSLLRQNDATRATGARGSGRSCPSVPGQSTGRQRKFARGFVLEAWSDTLLASHV